MFIRATVEIKGIFIRQPVIFTDYIEAKPLFLILHCWAPPLPKSASEWWIPSMVRGGSRNCRSFQCFNPASRACPYLASGSNMMAFLTSPTRHFWALFSCCSSSSEAAPAGVPLLFLEMSAELAFSPSTAWAPTSLWRCSDSRVVEERTSGATLGSPRTESCRGCLCQHWEPCVNKG